MGHPDILKSMSSHFFCYGQFQDQNSCMLFTSIQHSQRHFPSLPSLLTTVQQTGREQNFPRATQRKKTGVLAFPQKIKNSVCAAVGEFYKTSCQEKCCQQEGNVGKSLRTSESSITPNCTIFCGTVLGFQNNPSVPQFLVLSWSQGFGSLFQHTAPALCMLCVAQ